MKALIEGKTHQEETIKLMWAAKFNLPPNDERLLRVTAREALEHINGMIAIDQIMAERVKERTQYDVERAHFEKHGLDLPPKIETKMGKEAQAVADAPHLTGDPEWDALELAETDPTKPPLQIAR